ncbi:hypothetical protein [Blastococcus sp. PRF04-17]|uniref:hypothetical protein n=1 Tax=Blastococcus sp. PRF04-17 TaxID=2933797 RepID=UPI001FF23010|nr:hypothetical protein [Blastococcus sp. PRF04-17]UOY00489.1 hypothetical protein MVA48_15990 [Blastococcus sp. PRF04-17]
MQVTGVEPAPASTISAAGARHTQSDDAPPTVPAPPTTSIAGGSSGCGGPGLGQGSSKGSAPVGAALGDPADFFFAPNAAARTAQAAGSVVTTTADPATRPD